MELNKTYRYKLKEWLSTYSTQRKRLTINKLVKESGQSKYTIKRVMYMKKDDTSYVRRETIEAICKILNKDTTDFEYPTIKK